MLHRSLVNRFSALFLAAAALGLIAASGVTQPETIQPEDDPVAFEETAETKQKPAEPGDDVVVEKNDGQNFRGVLVRSNRLEVIIEIAGIETVFKASDVSRIRRIPSFEEYYVALKEAIPDDNYEERLRLCRWIYQRRQMETAADELENLLDDFPGYEPALELLRMVNAELEAAGEPGVGGPRPTVRDVWEHPVGALLQGRLLSEEDANLIRVYEVNLKESPRLIIPRDVIDDLLAEYAESDLLPRTPESRRRFYSKPETEILDVMFRLQARHLYPRVKVLTEPESLNKFRLNVHRTWLINSCATNECHGGLEAGELFLFNRRVNDEQTVYSNLLTLERLTIDGEPLIDYDRPENSLLLQMGLSPQYAIRQHPRVQGWRPVFRDPQDMLFQRAVEWIRSMYQPRPEYPVEYEPPRILDERSLAGTEAAEEPEEAGGGGGAGEEEPVHR